MHLLIKSAHSRFEKCDLEDARIAFQEAEALGIATHDIELQVQAIVGFLRLAGESLDFKDCARWQRKLNRWIAAGDVGVPAIAWYALGALHLQKEEWMPAQRMFHRYLKEVRKLSPIPRDEEGRAWAMLANMQLRRGNQGRAEFIANQLLKEFGGQGLRGVDGVVWMLLGRIHEGRSEWAQALHGYQRAHTAYLQDHNWYHHLYVLLGYARIARAERNFGQADWYLEMVEKVIGDSGFGLLRREVERERKRLDGTRYDLVVDGDRGRVIKHTGETIALGRQQILLRLLKVLIESTDHRATKSEIIERVWDEHYRPGAHDNKLYYNINRLRALLEADPAHPEVLLNTRQGYRLAPGLRVQWISESDRWKVAKPTVS